MIIGNKLDNQFCDHCTHPHFDPNLQAIGVMQRPQLRTGFLEDADGETPFHRVDYCPECGKIFAMYLRTDFHL